MNTPGTKRERAKAIIASACEVLARSRELTPAFASHTPGADPDCYVLLHDATQLFCRAVSELYGEDAARRWSPLLPDYLLAHPDKCEETLGQLEQREFHRPAFFPACEP